MDAVEEIKSRLDVEDVVGEYVQLKRSGRNFKGLSPFSNEKTPSFVVSPEKQIWHDFSSGRGGDMFTFVMEVEGLDFRATLELLARKAGVDVDQFKSGNTGPSSKTKERLYNVLEQATKFYQVQFSKNKVALQYVLKKRSYTKETALQFRIGYSPNNGTALVDYLKKQKFTSSEIAQAGLSAQRYHGEQDMFRGRLMIPLQDQQGKVIGFTARLLEDIKDAPKYINTPQTVLYDKSRHVYGLHLAKDAIRKQKYGVIVEGNLDVIASHQAGVRQVVATAGTALTKFHLKTINRFAADVRLAFDQDKAGQNAAERSIEVAAAAGVSLSMITIPEGKDPDELIKKDPKLWSQAVQKKQYVVDWLIDRYKAQLDVNSAEGKRQFSDVMIDVIKALKDAVEQDHYVQEVAKIIGVNSEALRTKMAQKPKKSTHRLKTVKTEQTKVDPIRQERTKIQDKLLSLALLSPKLRSYLQVITSDMLLSESAQKLHKYLLNNTEDNKESLTELQDISDYVKIVRLQYETLYADLEDTELHYEVARLQVRCIEQYVKAKKALIIQQLQTADETKTAELLTQVRELDSLLN